MGHKKSKPSDGLYSIETDVNYFKYKYTIQNFSLRSEKIGGKIISPTCIIGSKDRSEWCLHIYPNGNNQESKEYVSVFLILLRPGEAKAKFKFSILNDKEEERNIFYGGVDDYDKNNGWGFSKFIKKDFLLDKSNGLLINDKVTILCEAEIIKSKSEKFVEEFGKYHANSYLFDDSFNIQTNVNKFNYVCSIRNFSLRPEKTGEKIISPTCIIGDKEKSEWCLWIYPNGDDEESKEYVSVYLTLLNPDKAKVKVRFSILNDKEEEINVDNTDEVINLAKNLGLGIPKFVKKDFLLYKSNGLLNDDKLTILCEGEIINFRSDDQDSTETLRKVTIPQSKLLSNYSNMFDSSLFTDCIVRVKDTEIKTHKAVLAARSPVFREIFNDTQEESQTNVIEIKDFRVEVVREMLKYIYTDEVSNMQNMASEVLAIADKYKLDRLKAISVQYLCDDLTHFNVCERFVLSEMYSTEILKEYCIELIIENAAWLAKTKEWKEFILVHPLLLESLFLKSSSTSSTESIPEKEKKNIHILEVSNKLVF